MGATGYSDVLIPWVHLDSARIPGGGELRLKRRGDEFSIMLGTNELMNSRLSGSEEALARLSIAKLTGRKAPRVLIGGLGMGCTLRAALDALPAGATVIVAELHEAMVRWCRGPLAELTERAVDDPRVELRIGDVAREIGAAAAPSATRYDAVLLDLYEGPHPASQPRSHPHYGAAALARAHAALRPGGILAIWSEDPDPRFERALRRARFAVRLERPGRGGRRHAVYLATAQ
jgi:spermidine synthase